MRILHELAKFLFPFRGTQTGSDILEASMQMYESRAVHFGQGLYLRPVLIEKVADGEAAAALILSVRSGLLHGNPLLLQGGGTARLYNIIHPWKRTAVQVNPLTDGTLTNASSTSPAL